MDKNYLVFRKMDVSYDEIKFYLPKIKKDYDGDFLTQYLRFPSTLSFDTIFENHITLENPTNYHYYIFNFSHDNFIIPIHKDILRNSSSPFAEHISESKYFNDEGVFIYSHFSFFHEETSKHNICRDLFNPYLFSSIISCIFHLMHITNSKLSNCFFYNKNNLQKFTDKNITVYEEEIIHRIMDVIATDIYSVLNTHEYAYYFFRYFGETMFPNAVLGYLIGSYKIDEDVIKNYFGVINGVIEDVPDYDFIEPDHDFELHLQGRKPNYHFNYNYIMDIFTYVDFRVSHHLLVNSTPKSNLEYPQYTKWMVIDNIYTLSMFPGKSIKFFGCKYFGVDIITPFKQIYRSQF